MKATIQEYYVGPTVDRRNCRSTYNVRMSYEAARRAFGLFSLPRLVVLSHKHVDIPGADSIEITAVAWLRIGIEDREKYKGVKNNPSLEFVEMDQTLRQALGLPHEDYSEHKVSVHKIECKQTSRLAISKIVGRRLVYCRPAVLQPVDIEKNIVRIPSSLIELIGVQSGVRISLCGVFKNDSGKYYLRSVSVAALEAKDSYIKEYEKHTEDRVASHRPKIAKLIYGEQNELDLHSIFVDTDTRDALFGGLEQQKSKCPNIPEKLKGRPWYEARFVQLVQPVLAFREPTSAIKQQVFALAAAVVGAVVGLYPLLLKWIGDQTLTLLVTGFIWLIAGLIAVWVKTKNQIG